MVRHFRTKTRQGGGGGGVGVKGLVPAAPPWLVCSTEVLVLVLVGGGGRRLTREERRGRGGLGPKLCVPKMVRKDFPRGTFRFCSRWSLWSGKGGSRDGGVGTRSWWLALLACGGAHWPIAFEPSAMTSRHPYYCGRGGGGGWWHDARKPRLVSLSAAGGAHWPIAYAALSFPFLE